jgi:hypothetical protein
VTQERFASFEDRSGGDHGASTDPNSPLEDDPFANSGYFKDLMSKRRMKGKGTTRALISQRVSGANPEIDSDAGDDVVMQEPNDSAPAPTIKRKRGLSNPK